MSGFTLDTSGYVRRPGFAKPLVWSDLSPFEQGYIEAILLDVFTWATHGDGKPYGFSDLAPETLALILKDCADLSDTQDEATPPTFELGSAVWLGRNDGVYSEYPPLAPYIRDDGKAALRERAEMSSGAASVVQRVARDWSAIAGEEVRVEQISGSLYGFCSEIGALRIAYRYRRSDPERVRAIHSSNRGSWCFALDLPHSSPNGAPLEESTDAV